MTERADAVLQRRQDAARSGPVEELTLEEHGLPVLWERVLDTSHHALDQFVYRSVTPSETVAFVTGIEALYTVVFHIHHAGPDLLVLPLRGASPICAALSVFEEEYGTPMRRLYLPIGTHADPDTGGLSGYSQFIKGEIIDQKVRQLAAEGVTVNRPMLIDEVQSGATCSVASKLVDQALREYFGTAGLDVVAAHDQRKNTRSTVPAYREFQANHHPRIRLHEVLLPLVTVDNVRLMDFVVRPAAGTLEPGGIEHLRLVHITNEQGREGIRTIVAAVKHPELLGEVLNRASDPAALDALGEKFAPRSMEFQLIKALRDYLEVSAGESPGRVRRSFRHTVDWFKGLLREVDKIPKAFSFEQLVHGGLPAGTRVITKPPGQ